MRLSVALAAALAAAPASAQSLLWTVSGSAAGDRCGTAVAAAGDVDSDGFADFAVGLPNFDPPASPKGGAVVVYGGANGFLLWVAPGSTGSALGSALGFLGDVNADGVPDLIAGAPDFPVSPPLVLSAVYDSGGAALALSGPNGSLLNQVTGVHGPFCAVSCCPKGGLKGTADIHLGSSVAGIGDADFDGIPDSGVCNRAYYAAEWNGIGGCPPDSGAFGRAYRQPSNALFATLWLLSKDYSFPPGPDYPGFDEGGIAGLANVNAGFRDFVASSPGSSGSVYAEKGVAKGLYFSVSSGDVSFGNSVANVGDVNGDGVEDFAVGAPAESGTGKVTVRSGITGAVILSLSGSGVGDRFGRSVAGLGDVDLDGLPDFAVGAPQGVAKSGYVRIFTGADGAPVTMIAGTANGDEFGASLSKAGDVNGDGRPELIVGAPGSSIAGAQSGSAQVWSLVLTGLTPFGTGAAGCAGVHHLSGSLPPKIGQLGFEVRCDRAPANALGLGLLSYLPLPSGGDPFGIGVPLYVDLVTAPALTAAFDLNSNAKGYASVSFPIVNDPSIVGLNVYLQALWIWPTLVCVPSLYGLSDTHGLSVTVLPP